MNDDRSVSSQSAFEELQRLANAYNYPPARLIFSDSDDPNRLPEFDKIGLSFAPAVVQVTYPEFERSISDDLRSDDDGRVRLGLASVVYWGHFGDGDRAKFAATRAGRTANCEAAFLKNEMNEIIRLVDDRRYGDSLIRAFALPEIGSTSFASKLITFLAPAGAGVLDQQIYEGLGRTLLKDSRSALEEWLAVEFAPWAWTGFGKAGGSKQSRDRTARGFDVWCERLMKAADDLNAASLVGPCGSWRAADVERAIYRALRSKHLASSLTA
jgi:hypothetical protein